MIIRTQIIVMMVLSLLLGCKVIDRNQVIEARKMSDSLLDSIAAGNVENAFPVKYFNPSQTKLILNWLRKKCDFADRQGNFINDFYISENGVNKVAFIYEYYLKCDSIRFILTYNLGKRIELCGLKLQPIEKDNFMITKPERRLKFKTPK